ncbi:cation:proton antiporter [Geobacter sulfurreducens]|jgi:CPA2 family monovalent cation:H+ antiporter-2|uniref:Monovalent cation/proton antiporter family protein n=1 Tax=Geobacter sulfurreducens (strain ATCC 51573 / DSM 12127 / PCA) TaxID=243231 RepID=Q74GI5_GEOSL|nr:cation:proton antiporter [Geobacter sulfurreducens]AAR33595.1 monovalent cation/proton antiporter family protein [Geobacter sulfurreducens PCA]AJY69990.1 sodium:proton exchanger [Geobacter sulfurreducens]QVW35531.1 cation:proton antiporter [Geobacter sulfurreducens]UAC04354.1 cation:proton antiporter [Geobacter sulfurreducens]UTG92970.1 cation:proton antiporter [Geobacter sulfurreducens]
MHDLGLIMTITGSFTAALLLGYLTHRLGMSSIVGYLLAGIAVGTHTPGFVADLGMAEQFAEIGVILLMFGVGLQFHVKELLDVRRVAIPGAVCQSAVATLLSCLLARWLGWSWSAGIVFGFAVSVASTVVLLRVLVDNNELHTPTGHIAVGWLVVEDIFTVFLLVILPIFFGSGVAGSDSLPLAIGLSVVKIALLVALTFFVGSRLIPRLLWHVAATRSRELFTLTVLVLALGIAVGSAKLFGVSMALGAFLAGMVVRQSDFSFRAASEALPMRDAFAVLFFVSVGMLFNPTYLMEEPGLVLATLVIILVGKPLAALVIVLVLGYAPRVALSIAVALAQIGEFSFILATVGKDLGVLGEGGANTLVAASIISISLNPLLYRLIGPLEKKARHWRLWRMLDERAKSRTTGSAEDAGSHVLTSRNRAIVVGYGPTGRTLARLLSENGIDPVIIEMNLHTVRQLNADGTLAIYGDATREETLKGAGVESAVAFILTSAGMQGSDEAIRLARELNPNLRIIARAAYLRDIPALRRAGADAVFSGEGEIALNMTEHMLNKLGATPEQIDRERERVRSELLGGTPAVTPLATDH